MDDIVHLVKDNPDYNNNWDDFLSSNAGRMLTELFAYIADQLATRIDWTINENFIGTATQKSSVMRILKLIGYNFQLPIGADVQVELSLDRPIGDFYLTEPYDPNTVTLSPYTLTAKDKSGNTKSFECLEYDNENNRFEYKTGVEIESGTSSSPDLNHILHFYEGTTIIDTFTATTDNNPVFTLVQSPVIENSVRVYKISVSGGITTETELEKVNSFLDPRAQQDTDSFGNPIELPYILTVGDDNTVVIEFGSTALLANPDRRLRVDDQIRVFYRVGGGADGNITVNSINTTKRLIITPIGAITSEVVNASFVNDLEGVNGQDAETSEHATVYAPLQIRTAQKAVTEDDYNILLNADNTILKAKSYGCNNMPSDLYTLYGVYIKPLEIWNFVLKDKAGWRNINPSQYNDFRWITLRLENRFNEKHTLRDGDFNYKITRKDDDVYTTGSIDWDKNGVETFKNYVLLDMPDDFIDNIFIAGVSPNPDLKLKFCVESVSTQYFRALSDYNMLYEPETNNSGLIEGDTPIWQIYQPLHAYYLSSKDVSGNIEMETNAKWRIALGFDNREDVEIDIIHGYQEFSTTDTVINSILATAYTFKLDLDGVPFNGGADLSITPGAGSTLADIAIDIQTAIDAVTVDRATVEINGITGRVRIISDETGTSSEVEILAPGGGNSLLTLLSGVETKMDCYVIDPDDVTPADMVTTINKAFETHENYNNTATGTSGQQEFGLAFAATADSGLAGEFTYNFRVNGEAFSVTTEADIKGDTTNAAGISDWITNVNTPGDIDKVEIGMSIIGTDIPADTHVIAVEVTDKKFQIDSLATGVNSQITFKFDRQYGDIRELITEALTFTITGDIENGSTTINGIDDNFDIDKVEVGMTIYDADGDIPGSTVVSSVDLVDRSFVISNPATQDVTDKTLYLYKFSCIIAAGDYRISSVVTQPREAVYIEHGATNDLIDALAGVPQEVDAPTVGSGPSGYHEFGLSVATVATSGYQECGFTGKVGNTALAIGTPFYFFAQIDGGSDIEWKVITAGVTKYSDLITALDAAADVATGLLTFSVDSGASWSLVGGDLRCTSDSTGTSSVVELGSEGTTSTSIFSALDPSPPYLDTEFETAYIGEAIYDSGLTNTNSYNFKINGLTYTVTLTSGTGYDDIVTDLNTLAQTPNFPVNFTASLIGNAPNQDIRITSDTNHFVLLESGDTDDLFGGMTHFSSFGTSAGGGDYSKVAEVVQISGADYIKVMSPSKGEDPSRVKFSGPANNDVTYWIFDFDPPPARTCYGCNRFTVIINNDLEDFGKVIFETGSLRLRETPRDFYVNYLFDDSDSLYIGRYHYDTYLTTEPAWREKGNRIYNTVYDEDTLEMDMDNSNFKIGFTEGETELMSIFAIEDDWTLSESEEATITSIQNPGVAGNINSSNRMIKLNIDGNGWVEMDITNDSGVTGDIPAPYELSVFVDRINVSITTDPNYTTGIYATHRYATIHEDGDKIVITSPTRDDGSSIVVSTPGSNDATQEFFGLKEGLNYTYTVTGDYFLEYETFDLTADLTTGSPWITDLSVADIAKVSAGMLLLEVSGGIEKCDVLEVDTTNKRFKVSKSAAATINNTTITVTHDLMKLTRITTNSILSNLPDLDFHLHFVWDRRFVESIYEDYPEGSLDEDIYDASLENNKIVGLNHVFKQTKFTTFDVVGTIYYDKIYSPTDVQQRVENALTETFGLESRDYREPVARSKVMALIHENAGVDYVEIDYLGPDYTTVSTNVTNTIECGFDELIVLSEKRYLGGEQIHGLKFDYRISEI